MNLLVIFFDELLGLQKIEPTNAGSIAIRLKKLRATSQHKRTYAAVIDFNSDWCSKAR